MHRNTVHKTVIKTFPYTLQLVLDSAQNTLHIPGDFNVPHIINDLDYG